MRVNARFEGISEQQLVHFACSLMEEVADASLVLLAEHLGHGRILTTDGRIALLYAQWRLSI